jgi:hypothetical protein
VSGGGEKRKECQVCTGFTLSVQSGDGLHFNGIGSHDLESARRENTTRLVR